MENPLISVEKIVFQLQSVVEKLLPQDDDFLKTRLDKQALLNRDSDAAIFPSPNRSRLEIIFPYFFNAIGCDFIIFPLKFPGIK